MTGSNASVRVLPTETYFALVRQQLSDKGQAYIRVTGNSMTPLLRHLRDGVIIEPPGKPHAGDIVLFDRKNGRYALHRVIRAKKNGFTMAGDHQWHIENNLPYDQIVGVVTAIVRGGHFVAGNNFFLKIYSMAMISFTFPRIYLRKVIGWAIKPFRRPGARKRKGACS